MWCICERPDSRLFDQTLICNEFLAWQPFYSIDYCHRLMIMLNRNCLSFVSMKLGWPSNSYEREDRALWERNKNWRTVLWLRYFNCTIDPKRAVDWGWGRYRMSESRMIYKRTECEPSQLVAAEGIAVANAANKQSSTASLSVNMAGSRMIGAAVQLVYSNNN